MKKKLWCVLCIMICMMMIAACGQKKNPEKKKSEKAEQEETEFKDREIKFIYSVLSEGMELR